MSETLDANFIIFISIIILSGVLFGAYYHKKMKEWKQEKSIRKKCFRLILPYLIGLPILAQVLLSEQMHLDIIFTIVSIVFCVIAGYGLCIIVEKITLQQK